MIRVTENRVELIRKRRRKRWLRRILVIVCCLAAFFLGKLVGLAQKKQDITIRQEQDILARRAMDAVRAADGEVREDKGNSPSDSGTDGSGRSALNGKQEEKGGKASLGQDGEPCLILVNRDNPLPDDYRPELVTLQNGKKQSAKAAYPHLCDMLRAGIREGLTFTICSAYRSVERQKELFDEDVRARMAEGMSYERACEEVSRETMPPGCSEHSTGLAFDIVSFEYQVLDEKQADTPESRWLREHCAEYGFILRYPKGKEEITGIRYESWHFRYVGVEAAKEITEQGITLEEYLERRELP